MPLDITQAAPSPQPLAPSSRGRAAIEQLTGKTVEALTLIEIIDTLEVLSSARASLNAQIAGGSLERR